MNANNKPFVQMRNYAVIPIELYRRSINDTRQIQIVFVQIVMGSRRMLFVWHFG